MSARLIRVPDGKREHIGVVIDNNWQPICGQWSGDFWLPAGISRTARHTVGTCRDCVTVAGCISDLGEALAIENHHAE